MKYQQVFSYKKGQPVPSWVQYLHGGNAGSSELVCVFGSSGKLYVLPNGDLVTYPSRPRDRGASIIYINNAQSVAVIGAGNNKNVFHLYGSPRLARRVVGIRVTTKTRPLPHSDPRTITLG